MSFEKIFNTTGLFLGGTCLLLKARDHWITHGVKESPVTLLSTGAILFPLTILIGVATKKIFDEVGWQSSETWDLTIYLFTFISSTALTSAAAVGFGFTASLSTGLTVSLIAIELFIGTSCICLGIENVYSNTNHPAPRIV